MGKGGEPELFPANALDHLSVSVQVRDSNRAPMLSVPTSPSHSGWPQELMEKVPLILTLIPSTVTLAVHARRGLIKQANDEVRRQCISAPH